MRCTPRAAAPTCCSRCFNERDEGVLKKGWQEPAVKEALDLCLSCKGCKKE